MITCYEKSTTRHTRKPRTHHDQSPEELDDPLFPDLPDPDPLLPDLPEPDPLPQPSSLDEDPHPC